MKKYDLYFLLLGLACSKGSFTLNEAFEYTGRIDSGIEPTNVFKAIDELARRDIIIPKENYYELWIK